MLPHPLPWPPHCRKQLTLHCQGQVKFSACGAAFYVLSFLGWKQVCCISAVMTFGAVLLKGPYMQLQIDSAALAGHLSSGPLALSTIQHGVACECWLMPSAASARQKMYIPRQAWPSIKRTPCHAKTQSVQGGNARQTHSFHG